MNARARTLIAALSLRGTAGPGGGTSAHPRCRPSFLRAQNAVVGWDQPSPALPQGPGAPGPRPRPYRAGQAGCRAAAAGGDASAASCGHRLRWATLLARCFLRPQRCTACGGRPRVVAPPDRSGLGRTYLEGIGLAAMLPPRAPLDHCLSTPPDVPSRPFAVANPVMGSPGIAKTAVADCRGGDQCGT